MSPFPSLAPVKGAVGFLLCLLCLLWLILRYGLPIRLRRVLHRAFDHLADSGHAARKTGWNSLRAVAAGHAVCDLWAAGAPGVLCEPAADGGNVLCKSRGSTDSPDRAGMGD